MRRPYSLLTPIQRRVEFQLWEGGLRNQYTGWYEKLASGAASMEDYEAWRKNPIWDEEAAERHRHNSLPHLMLE